MNKTSIIIAINDDLKERIQSEAARFSLSMSSFVRLVLMQHLESGYHDTTTNRTAELLQAPESSGA